MQHMNLVILLINVLQELQFAYRIQRKNFMQEYHAVRSKIHKIIEEF
jgi:hypothetical protein